MFHRLLLFFLTSHLCKTKDDFGGVDCTASIAVCSTRCERNGWVACIASAMGSRVVRMESERGSGVRMAWRDVRRRDARGASSIGRIENCKEFEHSDAVFPVCASAGARPSRQSPACSLSAAWGDLRQLKHLDLSNNAYSGVLCSELGVLTQLTSLRLANNSFIGVLGSELSQLTALRELDVSNNRLRGTVPSALRLRALASTLSLVLFPGNVGLEDASNPSFDRSKAIDYKKDQKTWEPGKCERKPEKQMKNPFL
jgi:Leucine-rich repeat (LRR) protein